MKNNRFKYIFPVLFISFLVACSTEKDTFMARNYHALIARDNILYNGEVGFEKGMKALESGYIDNFWKLLPVERLQIDDPMDETRAKMPVRPTTSVEVKSKNQDDETTLDETAKSKNSDFEVAETKATKAIQKHSMDIDGRERNSQIDEAYLMLGQARYYDQRFLPALEAFNYILYKYPTSSTINTAIIWREKTNIHLGNEDVVVRNIPRLIKGATLKKQVYADANAVFAQAFINLEKKDSAIGKLRIAEKFTRKNSERARYRFILGQLYQETNTRDSALYFYQSVINMNRRSERKYVINAYIRKAQLFDYENGDSKLFIKTYNKLLKDRENRPFLDAIYYQMGDFFDKKKDEKLALKYYNSSLKRKSKDSYLVASTYRDIGKMYFRNANYMMAAKYYDSTLVKMNPKIWEYIHIKKMRKNLDDVIKYEAIAIRDDSIINVAGLSDSDRLKYLKDYIGKLKIADKAKRILEEKQKEKLAAIKRNTEVGGQQTTVAPSILPVASGESDSPNPFAENKSSGVFYFYNPTTVAYGRVQFKKIWGNRDLNSNWRLASGKSNANSDNDKSTDEVAVNDDSAKSEITDERYTVDFYEKLLPKDKRAIDSIIKERNFSYYKLGIIYKEKFKEYELASKKLEQLLRNNPEEKLILPSMYNLYKIYEITDPVKAVAIKNDILTHYPDSRYAQIISKNLDKNLGIKDSEKEYQKWYKLYQEKKYTEVLNNIDNLIIQYLSDEIVSKFELLKANVIGKTEGLAAYKKAMKDVAENYPTSEEGKNAQDILTNQIPFLEKQTFTTADSNSWKILYKIDIKDEKARKTIEDAVKKFFINENFQRGSYSFDQYNSDSGFVTIHGITSKGRANYAVKELKENEKYNLEYPAIIISSDNYSIIQINKNLETYLTSKTP